MNHAYKHHLGHWLFMAGSFLLLVGLIVMSPVGSSATDAFGAYDIAAFSNKARSSFGLPNLTIDHNLNLAAQQKADDMARLQYFGHIGPDGKQAWDYLKQLDYHFSMAGENLAITNEQSEQVVDGWLNSLSHRDNLLNPQFEAVGIGLSHYGKYEKYPDTIAVVALFATPSSDRYAPLLTARASGTFFAPDKPYGPTILAVSVGAIIAGVYLETRHIKHLHRHKLAFS